MKQVQQQRACPTRPKSATPPVKGERAGPVTRALDALPNHRAAGALPGAAQACPDVAAVVEQARRAPRTPLPHADRVARELGISPSALEVHCGAATRAACERLGAKAFAVQNVVVFAEDQPSVAHVRHELAHVIQQRGAQSPAPSRYAAGSLALSEPGSRPEVEAVHLALEDPGAALSGAPVMVCRTTESDATATAETDDESDEASDEPNTPGKFATARKRIENLANQPEFKPVDHPVDLSGEKDTDKTKFGISNGKQGDDEEFDPVFTKSSSKVWKLDDYINSTPKPRISNRAAREDLSQRIFRRQRNTELTRLADDAVAHTAFSVGGRGQPKMAVWASRVVAKDVPATDDPGAITTSYVFLAEYYLEGTAERGKGQRHSAKVGEVNPYAVVNDKEGKRRKKPDPIKSLGAYATIVENLVKVAAGEKLRDMKGPKPKPKAQPLTGVDGMREAIQNALAAATATDVASAQEAQAKQIRDKLQTWVLDNYLDVNELYAHVIKAPVFPAAYNAIKGAIFVEYVGRVGTARGVPVSTGQIVFGDWDGLQVKPTTALKGLRRGDGMITAGNENHILEGKARTEKPKEDEIEQMQDYRIIVHPTKPIPGYILKEGEIVSEHIFSAVEYYVGQNIEVAEDWNRELSVAFRDLPKGYRIHPNPTLDPAKNVTIQLNPLLTLPIPNPERLDQTVENVPVKQPGVTIKKASFKLARPLEAEIASGTLVVAIDMKGAVASAEDAKPKAIIAIPATEAKPVKPGGPLIYGRVDNQFRKLRSSLDNFFKERVRTDAKLIDDGIQASLWVTPGKSGIPGINLDEAIVTATLDKRGLRAEGRLGLSNEKGTVKGGVVVKWDVSANQWGVKGSVTFTDLINGLKPITAHFEYDAANDNTRIWAEKVEILKTYGGITLHGWATGLEYDVSAGEFSGHATLKADLGAFGEAQASGDIQRNRIVRAQLMYTTPRLKYPKKSPVLEGDITGAITYIAPEGPDAAPTFDGRIVVDAAITAAPLKKLAKGGRLAVVGTVTILPNGAYRGSIETIEPLTLGKHFRIPPFKADVAENGDIALAFSLQVVNVGLLRNAQVDCLIDNKGFHFKGANVLITVGTDQERVWGQLGVIYAEGKGFTVGGEINLRIKKGLVVSGRALYNSETGEVDAQLGVKKPIKLLDYPRKPYPIWDFSKQVELISFFKIVGIYLDVGFELAFIYDFGLYVQPTIFVRGLSFNDFSFRDVRALMKLFGKMEASLEAAPNVGLGLFVISTSLLHGGGGIRVPIVGKATLQLEPPLIVEVIFTNEGDVSAGGTVGLTLLFGITGAIEPYATFSVIGGLWNPTWRGKELYGFTLLKERPIYTYVVDFGKPLTTVTEPDFPKGKEAPSKPAAAKRFDSKQIGGTTDKDPVGKQLVEQPHVEEKPKAANDAGFDLGDMVKKLENSESFRPIKEIIDLGSHIFKFLRFLFGPVIKFLRWIIGGAVELIRDALRAIKQYGALIPYVLDFLEKRLHPKVFAIVKPMLKLLAQVEKDIYDLFDLKLPRTAGEMISFSFTLIKKTLKLAWNTLSGLVKAIRDTAKAVGDAVNYFLGFLVDKGRIGVRRHVRYIGSETLGLAKYFLFPDEYKVIDVGGFTVGPKEDDDWYPDPDKAIAAGLWIVLHKSSVPPTENYIEPNTGDPIENYWVPGVELKARHGGAPHLTPMLLKAVSIATGTSEGEPLPVSMQRRLQTVPTPELSAIRIHTDDAAAAAAEALDAHAFTVGHDIYFAAGEYRPWTPDGERLLAHEVAHATWTARASWPRYGDRMSMAGHDRERQADVFADALLSSGGTRRT